VVTAAEQLTRRLVDLATQGRRPRCGEPGGHELWTSDDADDRAQAASWCTGCPVLDECAAAADEHDERFGVFGGTDRTPPPAKRKSASTVDGTELTTNDDRRRRLTNDGRRTDGRRTDGPDGVGVSPSLITDIPDHFRRSDSSAPCHFHPRETP